jgi:hypothetical protein
MDMTVEPGEHMLERQLPSHVTCFCLAAREKHRVVKEFEHSSSLPRHGGCATVKQEHERSLMEALLHVLLGSPWLEIRIDSEAEPCASNLLGG